jgi:hypothetical protein
MKRYMERPSTDFLTNYDNASERGNIAYTILLTFFQIWGKREVRYNVVQAHADIRPIIR